MTQETYSRIISRYQDMVFRLALHYLKNVDDAQDIVQNVFLKFLKGNPALRREDHIRFWLVRVTANECKKLLSSAWMRRTGPLEEYAAAVPFESPSQRELFLAVMALPWKYRVPIYLFYYEGYTAREISLLLNRKESTVQTWLDRGRRQLKKGLQEE